MTLIKHIYENGTGDYADIETGFTAMLASGLSMSGEITDYLMLVDSGVYSGTLVGTIPYSGIFTIQGDYGSLYLTSAIDGVSGNYLDQLSPSLTIKNMDIINSGVSGPGFVVSSGFGLMLDDVQLLSFTDGIYNEGSVILNKVSALGTSGQYFLYSTSYANISNSIISNFNSGIYVNNSSINIDESFIHHNTYGVYSNLGTVGISESLLYDNSYDIYSTSGIITLDKTTSNSFNLIDGDSVYIDKTILMQLSGTAAASSHISNSNIYPSGYSDTVNISGTNNIEADPKFNNPTYGDYRLKFEITGGSPCVEHVENPAVASGVTIQTQPGQVKFYDYKGMISINEFIPYIYSQGSSIVISDYGKEIKFAETKANFGTLAYEIYGNALFSQRNVQTQPAFDPDINDIDMHPWDWDYKEIQSTQIDKHNNYIIPRSIINIEDIIQNFLTSESFTSVLFEGIVKENIKVYNNIDYRGIAYDSNLSSPVETINWIVDGGNQSLIKQNTFTGENINEYPLLSSIPTKTFIKPSGLIYITVDGDYYRFRREDDPNIELLAENEQGYFQWICTDINTKYDLRGVLAYKDNVYITASDYQTSDVTNRSAVPSGSALGKLLWYSNNDLFYNYIKKPGTSGGPKECVLTSGNYYPTDITAYEDGSIFVADYYNASGLYRYKLAYDYALIQSSYDNELKVLLREAYNNVDL
jgi:hypothetical protein